MTSRSRLDLRATVVSIISCIDRIAFPDERSMAWINCGGGTSPSGASSLPSSDFRTCGGEGMDTGSGGYRALMATERFRRSSIAASLTIRDKSYRNQNSFSESSTAASRHMRSGWQLCSRTKFYIKKVINDVYHWKKRQRHTSLRRRISFWSNACSQVST